MLSYPVCEHLDYTELCLYLRGVNCTFSISQYFLVHSFQSIFQTRAVWTEGSNIDCNVFTITFDSWPYFSHLHDLLYDANGLWQCFSEGFLFLLMSNFFMTTSGWRCDQYSLGSNIYLCVPIWCQWCRHCSCYITVRTYLLLFPCQDGRHIHLKVYDSCALSFVIVYGGTFCRYLIASILLWRLRLHVDLLPPSFKHLQFGRFLKNGNLFLIHLTPTKIWYSFPL